MTTATDLNSSSKMLDRMDYLRSNSVVTVRTGKNDFLLVPVAKRTFQFIILCIEMLQMVQNVVCEPDWIRFPVGGKGLKEALTLADAL